MERQGSQEALLILRIPSKGRARQAASWAGLQEMLTSVADVVLGVAHGIFEVEDALWRQPHPYAGC